MAFQVPTSMKVEHDELHETLKQATEAGGRTGTAAKRVAAIMHAHFESEEAFALPPLGLLPQLAADTIEPGMADVLPLTDMLKQEMPRMLSEHEQIVAALKKLMAAATSEKKYKYVRFAEKLMLHAQNEEQVAYPTAILIGEYVRWKLNMPTPA